MKYLTNAIIVKGQAYELVPHADADHPCRGCEFEREELCKGICSWFDEHYNIGACIVKKVE